MLSLFASLEEMMVLQIVSGSVSTTRGTHSCTILHVSKKRQRSSVENWSSYSVICQTTGNEAHWKHASLGKKKLAVGIRMHNSVLITCTLNLKINTP